MFVDENFNHFPEKHYVDQGKVFSDTMLKILNSDLCNLFHRVIDGQKVSMNEDYQYTVYVSYVEIYNN